MFLWRVAVKNYQNDIVKGYYRIVICEKSLNIPYNVTLRKNLEDSIEKNPFIYPKPQTFEDFCKKLTPKSYEDKQHILLDNLAMVFALFGFFSLFFFV